MLGEYSCNGGSQHSHAWEAEEAEDENRVEDDVDDRPGALDDHGMKSVPGTLQDALTGDIDEDSQAEEETNCTVLRSHPDQFGVAGKEADESLGEEETDYRKEHPADQREGQSVACSFLCRLQIPCTEFPGQ